MEHATRIGARIRACRLAKGLSASALATRAGVTENAIRKIESGDSKEPRFSTGVRIAAALGVQPFELTESARDASRTPPNLAHVLRCIRQHREELAQFGVAHVSIFGSVARGEAGTTSDIDVIVEPSPDKRFTLFDLAASQRRLAGILRSRVDVVTPATLLHSQAGLDATAEAVNAF